MALPASRKSANMQVVDVFYWRHPMISGSVFAVGLFGFLLCGVWQYSSITVGCYVLILNLLVRLAHTNGSRVLAEMNVIPKRYTPPSAPDTFITEEQVQARVSEITAHLNHLLGAAFSLLCGECCPVVLKTIAGLFVVSIASRILGTTGLLFLVFLAAFSLPRGYELKKAEVDELMGKMNKTVSQFSTQALQMIPKASDLKKEK